MSVNINVYTASKTLPIDQILDALRARGLEPEWEEDGFFGGGKKSWDAGTLTTPDGDRVDLSVQEILPSEERDLVERAPALSEEAGRLAGTLTNSYRLRARRPSPLLSALADAVAELTPSLILDPDSNTLYDRPAFRRGSTGAS